MPPHYTLLLFMGLLLLAVLVEPAARRIHLPFCAALVIVGFVASEAFTGLGYDTGLRAGHFHTLVVYIFLPILIFEAAFQIDAHLLLRNLAPVLFLAIPVMLLSVLITAGLVYAGIAHPTGFPWIAALLTGALLSATDPVAVVTLLREAGAPPRLGLLLEGESLFNDATAIVVFGVVLALASQGGDLDPAGAALQFARVFFGGMLCGTVIGLLSAGLLRLYGGSTPRALLSLIGAYAGFMLAEELLHVSGVMSVLATGLIVGHQVRRHGNPGFTGEFWGFLAWVANALVFLLMGVTVTLAMFEERWLAMLIGVAGVLVARGLGIFVLTPILTLATPVEPVSLRYRTVMFWGGLRGAITLALALSLPVELEYWWTVQSIAFGVVLFTLLVQAPTMEPLIYRLGLTGPGRGR